MCILIADIVQKTHAESVMLDLIGVHVSHFITTRCMFFLFLLQT